MRQTSTSVSFDTLPAASTSLTLPLSGQLQDDADQAILPKVAEVAGGFVIGAKVVRIDRPEQRIVEVGIEPLQQLHQPETGLDARWRQLEMVRRHVAVGAGAPVAIQATQAAVEERQPASNDGRARLATAERHLPLRGRSRYLTLRRARRDFDARLHEKCGHEREEADDQDEAPPSSNGCLHDMLLLTWKRFRRAPRRVRE